MTSLATPKVSLKLVPVPKSILYPGIAGEVLKNTGMKDNEQIQAVQHAVSEGLIEKIIIAATHPDGRVEKFTLTMKPFSAGETVMLHIENGKSYLESLDVGLAAAVQYAANLINRQGLTPRFSVAWSARAQATPGLITATIKRLNLKVDTEKPTPPPVAPTPMPDIWDPPARPAPPQRYPQTVRTYTAPPPLPPNYLYQPVLSVTPQKDHGLSFDYETSRKVTP